MNTVQAAPRHSAASAPRARVVAGYEVIRTGPHRTPERIVATDIAEDIAEDVPLQGLSVRSGTHPTIVETADRLGARLTEERETAC
ncbi:hypothetical protein ACFVT5_06705 [Streptomyces sp. NPDC058001]|uniref:hypothetical protein n=1 Tax=Streptomyces sp. NPDC058001 TaxID=3346300 RepID=UPI0036E411B4